MSAEMFDTSVWEAFTGPFTGPVADLFTDPYTDSFTGPFTSPFTGPVADPFTGPFAGPFTGPICTFRSGLTEGFSRMNSSPR